MAPVVNVEFLVVGAGPVGLTAAQLLANAGRSSMVAERRDGPLRHPAAHVVNARTLEIFRQAGLDMEAIDALAKDPVDAGHVNFVTRLNGRLIGRLPFEQQGPECLRHTPTPLRNISQHKLEPIMSEVVAAAETVDLRYRMEWRSSTQDDDGVTSIVRDLETGDEVEVRSRYVLAADGAASRIRKSLDIGMVGPASLQSFIAIHFAGDLRSLIADRLGVLHFVMDPEVNGTFIAHDIDSEWVFMTSFDPEVETADDYGPDRCVDLVRAAVGEDGLEIEFLAAGSWHMSAQVAERMRADRIFLIGDAAHRFPPTGGLGLNTGVADAHDLVWKLLAVEDGWADESILATYESERLPVAVVNCEQSTTNAFKLAILLDALGVSADPTTEGLLATLADPANAASIAAAVDDQATHFDMLGLQLGYEYVDGALVREGVPSAPIDDPSALVAAATVGARLPHAWLDDGRSTLDLIAADGLTLLSVGAHDHWAAELAGVAAPVRHLRLGVDVGAVELWRRQCGLAAEGALLVRPDQHIAWRADSPGSGLAAGVRQVLGC